MPDGLYDVDALAWSEQQAGLLRRLAAGEGLNEAVDWVNVIEEIECVGRSELRACAGLIRQALIHLLKLHAWPENTAAAHWRGETISFLVDATDAFSPSMRNKIEMAVEYRRALHRVRAEGGDLDEPLLPATCSLTLDDLLTDDPRIDALLAKLA